MADDKVKVRLLRALDGEPIGATVEYSRADAERLAGYGAVEVVGAKRARAAANKKAAPLANKGAPRSPRKRSR